ncbi:MAG: thioredoxin domain-containing protein [Rhodocyclales bacterium CG_4_10_14_3_um_filter_68_10]|nr:MAG: thioredoxin domain-containing protein [Rhodocyclales bacterium CG_4_10_14_3_um_filter_68_10]
MLCVALVLAAGTATAAPNRLIDSGSPYLLQHAHNPVDWYPWGPEAIEKARREGKPIFISVGYSTCYWCHVANRTLYQDPAIAALLNEGFVSIKIDREQRPGLDRLFMAATGALTGGGGWPNNVFLTPDLEPFFAGSYFPPTDDEFGRPGFITVLRAIREEWRLRRGNLGARARKLATALREQARPAAAEVSQAAWREAALKAVEPNLDREYGGVRTARNSKFPQPALLDYLLAEHAARPNPALLAAVTRALDAMAAGGIHDHLGGGFHRYTVERTWSVPHFEKTLYDNAQLLALYAQGFRLTGKTAWREVATGIATHLARDMEAAEGGFYTALDAGVGGEEGRPYLWSRGEIEAVLGAEPTRRFLATYELHPASPRERADPLAEEAGVLRLRTAAAGAQAAQPAALARLLAARMQRPQPARDEKQVVALNGLAIAALASSAQALRAPAQLEQARRAGERLWSRAWDERGRKLAHELFRGRPQGNGLLEDYAHLARGFLALHEAGAGAVWRSRARQTIEAALARLRRPDGRLAASTDSVRLPIPLDDAEDYAYPSGTSAAVEVLLRLGEPAQLEAAAGALRAAAGQIAAAPYRWPALLAVLARHDAVATRALVETAAVKADEPRQNESAAHVAVAATLRPQPGAVVLELSLQVEDGWHVNANPASFAYLVPTKLLIANAVPRRIVYPQGKPFAPRFAPEPIRVYEGKVAIRAEFPPGGADGMRARLSVQACNETVCLAPSTLDVPLR